MLINNREEGPDIFEYFQKLQPMNAEEIAFEFETTRQNISRILKDVMQKLYYKTKYLHRDKSPFEIAIYMLEMFGFNQREENEISKFYKLFPKKERLEIERDGRKILAEYRKHTK